MNSKSAAKFVAVGAAIGAIVAMGVAAPAGAAPVRYPVDIVVHTDFSSELSAFEGNIPGCSTGWVEDVGGGAHFTPWGGAYVGVKEFTCDGGGGGFTVSLKARFGEPGSTGSWNLTESWGSLEGIKASGTLVGTPTEIGIDDRFTGGAR